jgi:hypothetical protein
MTGAWVSLRRGFEAVKKKKEKSLPQPGFEPW